MSYIPSPEQRRIKDARQGGYIVVANAGTGKTTTTADLVASRYLDEERAMYGAGAHVDGDRQRRLLRHFTCVTFTVKAAADLDRRIKAFFAERGIPVPTTRNGQPYRIARTLDSFVQKWLRERRVFDAWMSTDTDTKARLVSVCRMLPASTRATLGMTGNEADDVYAFSKRWSWIVDDDVASMLLDLSLRHDDGGKIDGCNANVWGAQFNSVLSVIECPEWKIDASPFWAEALRSWRGHNASLERIGHDLRQSREATDDTRRGWMQQCDEHERYSQMREEFVAVQELARARGYHPIYAPEKMAVRSIEDQLAAGEHMRHFSSFVRISQRWHRLKTHFLLREFGDQTTAFVRACESYPELLERGEEYPSLIRTKYVFWDEVQDNSDFQHRILKLFYGRNVPYLSVAVGDPKQQIYCWRGASPRGFLAMIEKKRQKEPEKLLGLTCSFRSARNIVALGNEIIQTLPSYRDNVQPSTTIYEEAGEVRVSPPFVSLDEEAEWAIEQIETVLARTNDTVMVLSRTDLSDHPVYVRYLRGHQELDKRLSCLTIHRSKGLEAGTVIVLGLVAGRLPDCRANSDEEANLFYVACTRAIHCLMLSGQMAKRTLNSAGRVEDVVVGPSPYFWRLPSLKALCLKSGWTEGLLRSGVDAQNQLLAIHLSRVDKHRGELRTERNRLFPQVELPSDAADGISDYGSVPSDPDLAAMPTRRLARGERKGNLVVAEGLRTRVQEKLAKAYRLLPDRLPRLSSDEFQLAARSGWICRAADNKYWRFSEAFEFIAKRSA